MESYQTLNRELVLTVRDLRKENFDLRDLVTSLKSENMTITSEFSDFKRRALEKFMKFSEIIGSVGADLFGETPKTAIQQEMSKVRYSVGMNSSGAGSLPRSSPEKMPRKPGSFHVNVGRRRGGQRPKEVERTDEEAGLLDMSIDDIQGWLRTDRIEISLPIKDDHEEAQPAEDISQIHEEATQESEERPQEVPENVDGLYKNMTTILEENSKSISHNSLLQMTKFASSTPHNNNKPVSERVRMDVSPIEFRKCDQRCLQTNFEKMNKIFERKSPEVSQEHSISPVMAKNITIRRRERIVRESTPERPKETSEEANETPEEPKETPEEPKKAKKNVRRKKLADKTNLTEKSTVEPPRPIKVEDLDEIVVSRRPKRRAAPQNLTEPNLGVKMRRN